MRTRMCGVLFVGLSLVAGCTRSFRLREGYAGPVKVQPGSVDLVAGETYRFDGVGQAPLHFSLDDGLKSSGATIDDNGLFKAPPVAVASGTVTLRDGRGRVAQATVRVSAGLSLVRFPASPAQGETFSFAAAGGKPPYQWAVRSPTPDAGSSIDVLGRLTVGAGEVPGTSLGVSVSDLGGARVEQEVRLSSALAPPEVVSSATPLLSSALAASKPVTV